MMITRTRAIDSIRARQARPEADSDVLPDALPAAAVPQPDLLVAAEEAGRVREALLALSSDWALMVTKDSAASYARDRAGTHELRFRKLADGVGAGLDVAAEALRQRIEDGPFEHLDARLL